MEQNELIKNLYFNAISDDGKVINNLKFYRKKT